MRLGGALVILLARAAWAGPLPFEDSFDDADAGFGRWTSVVIDSPNRLEPSTDFVFSGAQSLKVVFAGDLAASPTANLVLELDAGEPAVFVRLHLLVPAATASVFPPSGDVRIVRFGDARAVSGTPVAEVRIESGTDGGLYLVMYADRAVAGQVHMPPTNTTHIPFDEWIYVEAGFEPGIGSARFFVGDPQTPFAGLDAGITSVPAWSVRVGFPYGGSGAVSPPLTWYIDEVAIGTQGPIGPATPRDAGSSTDAGSTDAGVKPEPRVYRVGCGCDENGAPGFALLSALVLLGRVTFRRAPSAARRST